MGVRGRGESLSQEKTEGLRRKPRKRRTCWLMLESEGDVMKRSLPSLGNCRASVTAGRDLLVPGQNSQDLSLKDLNYTDGRGNKNKGRQLRDSFERKNSMTECVGSNGR